MQHLRFSLVVIVALTLACGGDPATTDGGLDTGTDAAADAASDGSAPDGSRPDGSTPDASRPDGSTPDGSLPDGAVADSGVFDAGPEPTETIWPVPGEVTIIQHRLPGVLRLGEAAALVGPDGTIVLMDVGNTSHDDEVRDLVQALNTLWVTPARGFPRARGEFEVDWLVISHTHADHLGAFANLFTGRDPLEVTRGVVHRGFVDLGEAMNEGDYEDLCDALRGSMASLDVPLCRAATTAPCRARDFAGVYPATACDGLFDGDLDDALDDAVGAPSFIALGDGARMVFVAADGFASDGASATPITAFGHTDTNEENARSMVALVEHGAFRYHWGGDLTGSGAATEPDVESHLASVAGGAFYGALGVDVVHAHHHARRTSNNATFVELTAPLDGRSRNVIGGINGGHIGSPHGEVLARFGDDNRLGDGYFWITMSASGGDTHPTLIDADANVVLQTRGRGAGYRIQAARATPLSHSYASVR